MLSTIHGVNVSLRQLHRLLRKLGLYRRKNQISINDTLTLVSKEITGSAGCFGYRLMCQNLRSKGNYVGRETTRMVLKSPSKVDPVAVEQRSCHRFNRRKYLSRGPNYLWHMDGYDKLKPYSFAIHGAIDGWSRKILWLYVGETNNNSRVVASFYLKCIQNLDVLPRCIRSDRGSENVTICGMQRFFRREHTDSMAGNCSFVYGLSTRNQRIESWWSLFRKNRCNFWINYFKDMCDSNILDPSKPHHIACIRFCYLGILQSELDDTVKLWNYHYIRKVRNSECPSGRPNVLYSAPHLKNGRDFKFPLNFHDINEALEYADKPSLMGCSPVMMELLSVIMKEKQLVRTDTVDNAKNLFISLVSELDILIN